MTAPGAPDRPVAETCDVVVVGGGPAGSTAATLIARRGHAVVLLERERFPRYQIGESLLPATVHGVCRLLGVAEEVAAAGFVRKRGGSFRWGTSPEPWNFLFAVSPELSGETSYAYQVERMRFDEILLRNAGRAGVDVREEAVVDATISEDGRVRGVRYRSADGVEHEVRARYVLDASGGRSRLHQRVGRRAYSPFFRNVAVFGYFEGGGRLPAPDSGNILCAAFDEGWLWYIPLSPTLTSLGAVVAPVALGGSARNDETTLRGFVERCPIVRDLLGEARRVTKGPYGEIRTRKDYSYATTAFWAPGMALVGDAACFIDPVFSTGVHLATYSGLLAARSVNTIFDGTADEQAAFDEFEGRYRREYEVFHEFLTAFYDMRQHESSYFWRARSVTDQTADDLTAFVTLVGGLSSGEGALTSRYSSSSASLSTAVDRTGAMQTPTGERMDKLFSVPVVGDVMAEMNRIQTRAVVGPTAVEPPLLPGGLVPSPDGLAWTLPAPAAGSGR